MKNGITLAAALLLCSALAVAGDKAADTAGQSALWDQADANRDGYISREEANAVSSATDFMASDKDSDGRVSKDEYAGAKAQARASDDSKNQARVSGPTEQGAAGPTGPESEK